MRGYVKIDSGASADAKAGFKVHWRDSLGTIISTEIIRDTLFGKATAADWYQHSGVRAAPIGAQSVDIVPWVETLIGKAYFDDVEAWILSSRT